MRILLDTHIALWAIANDPRLGSMARNLLEDPGNEIFVSAASVWEISIKHALSRGRPHDVPISGAAAIERFREAGCVLLPVTADHAAAVENLPPVHKDPFDRMLVAQAMLEPLRMITRDVRLAAYSATIIIAH